ncbi:MAG TPA: protease modulator HflC [Rhodospirillaceae bacterium]|jgi:membrane protease subunit HflC|nr:protease modulator HflC [Rhodospirillaceae bacterium]
MNKTSLAVIGLVVVALGVIVFGAVFTVHQAEQTLVLQFGNPVRVVRDPGIHFKIPFIQNVVAFDKRVLDFDAKAEEVPTSDQKQLVVDAFARYRIENPLKFYQTVNNERGMQIRLGNLINANLRAVFGEVSLATLLTAERGKLIRNIADRVKLQGTAFGINVLDVRLKRVDLPEANSQAIFRRMQTQREQEARKIRAEGQKDAKRIRADADKQRTIIQANAQKKGDILRGQGEAKAQNTYNAAYGQDRDFFDFWVSMNALSEGLPGESTRYIGPPDGDFFRFFRDITGKSKRKKPGR